MADNWVLIGYLLLGIAGPGILYQCLVFIRSILPANYGRNPGFGCFERMVLPWFLIGCIGAGLVLQSLPWAIILFAVGYFMLGFLAQLLARLFGNY